MLIGEVARRSGVSVRMLRHYDAVGLLRPTGRTAGGYREYSPDDVRRLFHVEGLRTLGLSLAQVGEALHDPGFDPSALVADLVRATEERLEQDRELLARLRTVDAAGPGTWAEVVDVVGLLRAFGSPTAGHRQQAALAAGDGPALPAEVLARTLLAETDPHAAGALRWALRRAVARAGDPDGAAVAALAAGLRSGEPGVRRRAADALADAAPSPAADAALADALADPDPAVRRRAAPVVGRAGGTGAVPELVAMVRAGVDDVEAAEILAALSHDDPVATGLVLDALTRDLDGTDPATRIRVAQALVELPGPGPRSVLRRLADDADRTVALVAGAFVERRS
ncbi:MerR family DNA-binding transcriptional regulator [Pseudonocardia sp. DR1-2]|uniref:MerR family transcriptional regulator n=1 Tax=Pseudonocardia sp. DR1-2 TaxID=2951168 RepID=UPI0020439299|nr:MerR family transcriptional regulator [Pseudonocardia sp. DR1-2]MCM3849631.1 MerR family DNA-binding transcriptional regulator [Pseudonocardia sp. DR1-2]